MAWDNDKSTAADPDNPQADEQLTADEWDNHVSEGHFPSNELNFGVDGNGDPVITDPQNGGQTVMRYDRSAGSWVVDALEAAEVNNHISAKEKGGMGAALNAANSGDVIVVDGDFSEEIVVDKEVAIVGASGSSNSRISGNSSNPTIDIDNFFNVRILGVRIENSGAGIALNLNSNEVIVTNCRIEDDVVFDSNGNNNALTGNTLMGNDITIQGNSNVVTSNLRVGTITDNGNGNQVGNNA